MIAIDRGLYSALSSAVQPVVVLGRRQQGLLTQKAPQKLKVDTFITKFQGFALLAALFSLRYIHIIVIVVCYSLL